MTRSPTEIIARAVHDNDRAYAPPYWDDCYPEMQRFYLEMAEAALAALAGEGWTLTRLDECAVVGDALSVFIGRHPCDDEPHIVGTDPDPRDGEFDRFRFGVPGTSSDSSLIDTSEDYSGWYVRVPERATYRLVPVEGENP